LVTIEEKGEHVKLILRPNCSLSWRGNQLVFLCLAVWLGSFALAFAAMGAWVILPFVGLELLVIAGSLYYVSWKLSHCEVVHITPSEVCVAKGASYPSFSLNLPRNEVVVHVVAASHPLGRPSIQLLSKRRSDNSAPVRIAVGEFLNQDDCKELLRQLVTARLVTRHSTEGRTSIAF
jgi:uncharacterized membrane protein